MFAVVVCPEIRLSSSVLIVATPLVASSQNILPCYKSPQNKGVWLWRGGGVIIRMDLWAGGGSRRLCRRHRRPAPGSATLPPTPRSEWSLAVRPASSACFFYIITRVPRQPPPPLRGSRSSGFSLPKTEPPPLVRNRGNTRGGGGSRGTRVIPYPDLRSAESTRFWQTKSYPEWRFGYRMQL